MNVEKIEYTKESRAAYVYFWEDKYEFAFELVTKEVSDEGGVSINIDYIVDGNEVFGIEMIGVEKNEIEGYVKDTLIKEKIRQVPDFNGARKEEY